MSDFIRVRGNQLVLGDTDRPVHLRGVAIYKPDLPEPDASNYAELAELNVNTIRLGFSYRHFYDDGNPNAYKAEAGEWIDKHVTLAREFGIRLILQNWGIEGVQFIPIIGVPFDYAIWKSDELQRRFIKLWQAIGRRYRHEPQIVGYSLFYEPVVSESKDQWRALAQRTIDAIRRFDRRHVVFVERIYGDHEVRREVSGVDLAPEDAFVAANDPQVVYEFYFFERDEYTHQFAPWRADVHQARVYPDENWIIHYEERAGSKRDLPFTRDYLKFYLERQLAFGESRNVPMAVWAFGALKSCYVEGRGGLQWLKDVIDLLNLTGAHWTLGGFYDEDFGIHDHEAAKAVLKNGLLPIQ